jgi:signal transduction histidine kinase
VYELRPSALENAGLVEALQHRLEAVEARAGIQTKLLADNDLLLDEAQEAEFYRVAVEALNNALKHAQATAVTVRIASQDEAVILTIEDNGRGFDEEAVTGKSRVGRHSMQERARQLGGELMIESEVGTGMAVMKLVAKGLGNQEISEQLVISVQTVRTHVSNILGKLHVANRTQAALYALREGIADLNEGTSGQAYSFWRRCGWLTQ